MSHQAAQSGVTSGAISSAQGRAASSSTSEFVSFGIGTDRYGVDIMSVREIKGWAGVSPLVGQPEYVRGVLNLRGAMVPIIDLRCRFGQGLTEATPMHIVIVVSIDDRLVGLLADQVLDIVAFQSDKIQPVPRIAGSVTADSLSGLVTDDEGMIALIELSKLLSANDSSTIDAAQESAAA